MRGLIALLLFAISSCAARQEPPPPSGTFRPTVILISFDGFRWDYPTKAPTPNLARLMARGVHADNLIPVFPSVTFPNHYTIVTGLYADHHGIVWNTIWDPPTRRLFELSKPAELRDPIWWGGEPIWVTAQRAGQIAATMFWPGSETPIGGMLPRYWREYDEDVPGDDRVDQALRWLDLPEAERPTLVTLYFEDTDHAGHDHGPESAEVKDAIARDDAYLGRLARGLERRGIIDQVNIIVVADHGMTNVGADRTIVIDDYVPPSDVDISSLNPLIGVFPRAGKEDAVYRALVGAHPHLKVYRREETPARWHYRDHTRIAPILGIADEGWQILRRATLENIRAGRSRGAAGQHGYDPALMSMRAIFVAAGPAFKSGARVEPFESVHLYNAIAAALHVTPSPNDGDPSVARRLLK